MNEWVREWVKPMICQSLGIKIEDSFHYLFHHLAHRRKISGFGQSQIRLVFLLWGNLNNLMTNWKKTWHYGRWWLKQVPNYYSCDTCLTEGDVSIPILLRELGATEYFSSARHCARHHWALCLVDWGPDERKWTVVAFKLNPRVKNAPPQSCPWWLVTGWVWHFCYIMT